MTTSSRLNADRPGANPGPAPGSALALFTALALFCWIDRFIMSALLTPIKNELHLTDEQIGRIEFSFTIAYVISAPLFGYLSDRLPRKWLVLGALLVWSLASMGSGLAFALVPLLFWRALVGLGEGAYQSIAPGWLADIFVPRVRNIAFSVFNSTSKIGATIGVGVGGAIAAAYSWHVSFIVAGAPGLLLAFFLLRAREPRRGAADGHALAVKPSFRESLSIFALPHYRLYLLGYFAYYIALGTLFLWGPAYMHRTFHLPNAAAAGFFGLGYTVTGLPATYLGGFVGSLLQRRTRAGYAFCLAAALAAVTPVLVVLLASTDLAAFRFWVWTEMFFFGFCSATATTLVFETVPVAMRGVAWSGTLVISGGLSAVVVTELVGILSDHFGLQRALLVTPVATLLGFAAWGWLGWLQLRERAGVSGAGENSAAPVPTAEPQG